MNKVYILAPGENWIVDRFVKEFNEDNSDIAVLDPGQADVIWVMADWCWLGAHRRGYLVGKKVITTVHHIVPEKFGTFEQIDFENRDRYTTVYHVPNKHTEAFIRPLTKKPIHVINYWANQKIWKKTGEKSALRQKYGIPVDACVVGSFQRDTEGAGISQGIYLPKLEKGPDLLADYIEQLASYIEGLKTAHSNLHVLLAGWRRQYLMARLDKAHVPYTYIELPDQQTVNELYQTLDLYPVTARYEGGPQSLIECGLLGVRTISRPVGIAEDVLPATAICDNVASAIREVPNVEHLKLPMGYEPYRMLIEYL